jgi:hypothetical protein
MELIALRRCNLSQCGLIQHQAVINDAAFSFVEEAAKYNSACVNTLRRSLGGYKLLGSKEKSWSRLFNQPKGAQMQLLKKTILSGCIIIGLAGCSTSPESDPAYVSPTHYSNYNCKQISAEMQRVSGKLEQTEQANATGQVLGTALAAYAISQGYGFSSGDNSPQRRLLNQYDVLEQTAIQKECGI